MKLKNVFKALYLKRYKRFFVDIKMEDGSVLPVHCPNTGSMKSILEHAKYAWCTWSDNPKRKLKATLELLELNDGTLVLVNTQRPNQIVKNLFEQNQLQAWFQYECFRPEQKYGEGSRIDFLLANSDGTRKHFVEVKNVTLRLESGVIAFPDAVTSRGKKHLEELQKVVELGDEATMLYLVSRTDASEFRVANEIDPGYGISFQKARAAGVKTLALKIKIGVHEDAQEIHFSMEEINPLPLRLETL